MAAPVDPSGVADPKKSLVLDVATEQFVRYGFRRVTMGDIATAAEMSRPALYLLFANKEAVFSAALARYTEAALAEIRAGVDDREALAERLRYAVEIWAVRPFELLKANPDARELTDCTYGFAAEVVESGTTDFVAIVTALLADYADALAARDLEPGGVAEVFARALKGFKSGAATTRELRSLLDGLIAMTVANCAPPVELTET